MVFISYKSEEQSKAYQIRDLLTANGIDWWIAPDSIPKGSEYPLEIAGAINGCDVFVLVLSKASQSSQWVRKELTMAVDNKKNLILPITIDGAKLGTGINLLLSNVQVIDGSVNFQNACQQMIVRIKEYYAMGKTSSTTDSSKIVKTGATGTKSVPTSVSSLSTVDSSAMDIFHFIPRGDGSCICHFVGESEVQGYRLVIPNQSPAGEYVVGFEADYYRLKNIISCDMSACIYVKSISSSCFFDSSVEEVVLPPNIESIEDRAFSNCSNLRKCDLSKCSHLVRIHEYAFSGCSLLRMIEFPEQMAFVSDCAFFQCVSATKITLNEGLQSIGNGAFSCCSSVTFVKIPSSVHTISEDAFRSCSKIKTIVIPEHMDEDGTESFSWSNNDYLKRFWGLDSKVKVKLHGRNIFAKAYYFVARLVNTIFDIFE